METKHTKEKTIEDAPISLNGDDSQIWCNGYNTALEKTAAPELLEALKEIIRTCNPTDVTPNKVSMGIPLGEYYVGGCSFPSDKAIHMAINAITK
jgi:hypothetical protein